MASGCLSATIEWCNLKSTIHLEVKWSLARFAVPALLAQPKEKFSAHDLLKGLAGIVENAILFPGIIPESPCERRWSL